MACGYIEDGYTLSGYIKELPGIYGAVHFKHRPLTVEQRIRLFEGFGALQAIDQIGRTTTALSKQIIEWDLQDAKGRPVSCGDAKVFRRLSPPLHERLLDIVGGAAAPDPDPQAHDESAPTGYAEAGEGNSSAG